MNALIGHTGFVGANLLRQHPFASLYNSKNIEEIQGREFELLVCAGVTSTKWKANGDPQEDFDQIDRLIKNIDKAVFKKLVLISTISVYDMPADNAYGSNRLYLETYLKNKHDNVTIVRLPSLFGRGLKKNPLYDLMNHEYRFLPHPDSTFQYYGLDKIWKDIGIAIDRNIETLNISIEPIVFQDILNLFEASSLSSAKLVVEDMQSNHAKHWGKDGPYLYSKGEVMNDIEEYIMYRPDLQS
jgi:hypothetical protein